MAKARSSGPLVSRAGRGGDPGSPARGSGGDPADHERLAVDREVDRVEPATDPHAVRDGTIPVAAMVESIVGCKWSLRLLQLSAEGQTRPSAFLRACAGLSAKVMNERLRKMMRFGIFRRVVRGEKPPIEVEYQLTPFGQRFLGILDEVRRLQDEVDAGAVESRSPEAGAGSQPTASSVARRRRAKVVQTKAE